MQLYLYKKKIKLKLPIDIRWGTLHKLLENTINSLQAIVHVLSDLRITSLPRLEEEASKLRLFFGSGQNIAKLKEIESVLRPVSSVIKLIEGDVNNGPEAYFKVMESIEIAAVNASWINSFNRQVKEEIQKAYIIFVNFQTNWRKRVLIKHMPNINIFGIPYIRYLDIER
jgi:hypothetical protein